MAEFERRKRNRSFVILICLSALFCVTVFLIGAFDKPLHSSVNDITYFGDVWVNLSEDESKTIGNFVNDGLFEASIKAEEVRGRSLCFVAKNITFDVYIDGTNVYSFRPSSPGIFGKFYGTYPHVVELDQVRDDSNITIAAYSIDESHGSISGVVLQNGIDYLNGIFRLSIVPLGVSLFITILGLALIGAGLAVLRSSDAGKEIAAMGLFAFVAGIWTSCSSGIIGIITGTPVSMHFVNYISLIILPGIAALFVYLLSEKQLPLIFNVITVVTVCTLVADLILTGAGISNYHDLLPITHFECLVTACYSFYCIFKTMHENKSRVSTRAVVTAAFISVTLGGIIDLARYVNSDSGLDSAYFFRIGLMIFILLLCVNELHSLLFYRKYESEALHMGLLAHTDALTGLANRMAYTEFENNVKSKENGKCTIVQFDINNLKKVNDNYGHSEGDRHITAAAKIIKESFSDIGECYRTGGDEFILVIEGANSRNLFDAACDKYRKKIDEYNAKNNPPVKLEIAYGVEEFDLKSDDVEKALKLADGKMYNMKKIMKGEVNE